MIAPWAETWSDAVQSNNSDMHSGIWVICCLFLLCLTGRTKTHIYIVLNTQQETFLVLQLLIFNIIHPSVSNLKQRFGATLCLHSQVKSLLSWVESMELVPISGHQTKHKAGCINRTQFWILFIILVVDLAWARFYWGLKWTYFTNPCWLKNMELSLNDKGTDSASVNFVRHKSHMVCPKIKPRPSWWEYID
jgi:hypothetical protein